MNIKSVTISVATLFALSGGVALAAEADLQKQIDEVKGALPKFAIPMREVGDRFQNIYFAAKDGTWALAAYMAKYMNGLETAYTAVTNDCNGCHQAMGYGFIKVVKMPTPADNGIDYKTIKSEPGDVPK